MRSIVRENKLLPGDRIIVPKSIFGVIQHHAIYLGKNHAGLDLIAENVVGKKVLVTTAESFTAQNGEITEIKRFIGSGLERKNAVERALRLINQPYDLINFNCENFANVVQHGVSFSNQVRFGVFLLLVLAVASVFSE